MKQFFALIGKGLAAVLPLTLSLYLIYWLLSSAESLLRSIYLAILPSALYFPGLGIILAVLLLIAAGLLVETFLVNRLLRLGEGLIDRIPLIKSVYSSLRDFMDFVTHTADSEGNKVVAVTLPDGSKIIGLVTSENFARSFFEGDDKERVGVYLPMSYQMGGYTIYYRRDQLEPLDIGVEEAMRIILTGGMTSSASRNQPV